MYKSPKTVTVLGYTVPSDSLTEPTVITAGEPEIVKVGKLSEVSENSNSLLAKEPKDEMPLSPVICIMGKDGFLVPVPVKAIENPFFCRAPEVVLVKDAYIKDVNPQNFSSFSKLQGLRHDQVRALTQDKMGNLWLGTDDGLTRYDGKYFSHYTTGQGLNNNLILSVFQDKKENIWFGTFNGGVTRFDGIYLTNFSISEGLSSNVVNCIFEDSKGTIWLGTGGGATKYDGNSFTNFSVKEGLCHNDVRAILEDNSGNIWIATNGGGVSVFNGDSFSNYSEKEGLIQNFIGNLFKDANGNIWLGSASRGVARFDGEKFAIYSENEGLGGNAIRAINQDKEGNMWFGTTENGLTKFDGKYFTYYGATQGLSSDYIRCSLQDLKGNLWFGTRGAGLTRFDGNLFTHLTANEGLTNSRVMSILKDTTGNLWLGTFGGYVTKYIFGKEDSLKHNYFSTFGQKEGLRNSRIYSMLQDNTGNIWFGTDGWGVSKFDGKTTATYSTDQGLCNNTIRKIYQDSNNNYWFASYGSGVSKFDGKEFTNYTKDQGLSANNVLCIQEDSQGNIWFGTDVGGLTCFDGKNFTHYTKEKGFFSNTIYSIMQGKDGILWFGTGGEGLIRYDGNVFTRYADDVGLNNNHVLSIIQDSKGNIFAGTRFGLNLLKSVSVQKLKDNKTIPRFKSYNYEDGFIGIGSNIGAIAEDNFGNIWVGTNDRLTVFHTEAEKTDSMHISLQLTNIQLFNENIPWTELALERDTTIILHNGLSINKFKFDSISRWYGLPEKLNLFHKHNYITFSFIGISHTQTKKMRYQYMLEGLDDNWNVPTDRTEVSYGNLNSGKYVFKVKAVNSEGYWSNEVSYHFSIRPPWWNTWWFYILSVLILVGLIYGLIIYRERRLMLDKQKLQLKVNEQTRQLTEKNKELQVINSEKDKLFSIIAHDLRSPFSSFLGLTQVMAEELETLSMDQLQEIAGSMRKSATNLFRLLENLLQWSRIQQGSIPFYPAQIELIPIVEESIALVIDSANKKGIEITYDIPYNTMVYADSNMLHTIIRNIISNAVKFTSKNGNVNIEARSTSRNFVEISIRDTGIGMSSLMVDNLFKLGSQTNRTGTDGEPSTGLGLIICKEFIDKLGGKIWVESEEGKGSVFYFTITNS
jgi:signal transduction histidine kinase/ligand-binding sensor domain-containing protein